MDTSFIQKLRMNNIFSPPGGGSPFGMPDLNGGPDVNAMMQNMQTSVVAENEKDRQHEINMMNLRNKPPALAALAKETVKPMNTVFNPGVSDYQRSQLAGRAADRESREAIASGRLGLGREQIAGRAELQDTRGNQMTDQIGQRGDIRDRQIDRQGVIRGEQIDQQGNIRSRQIGEQGANTDRQIGLRGDVQRGIQELRGTQRLGEIAATGGESRLTQSLKPTTPELPTQSRVRQAEIARELINTRPDLSKFLKVADDGTIKITQPSTGYFGGVNGPSPQQTEELNRLIYGGDSGNVASNEPARGTIPTSRANRSTTTLTPKKSKYKVSVE